MKWIRCAVLGLVLVTAALAEAQSIIELRPGASVPDGVPVVLSEVAVLSGADAEALSGIVIRERAVAGETISVDDLRRVLDRSARINWGRISLRGQSCVLRIGRAGGPAAGDAQEGRARVIDPHGTVRALVAARISAVAQAGADELRLTFAPEDDDLLNMASAGRTVEVTPTGMSDRLPLAVRIFENERIIMNRTIRVGVEVQRPVMIAGAARRRGESISEGDVTEGLRWLGLAARPAQRDQVIGASPRMRIAQGQVLMVEDVTPPTVVTRGEQVTVYCVRGTVVLTIRARAMGAGRDGELVQFQTLDNERTFFARMDGRGRALINGGEE
jgi:flagella basal body P-ring formation protein FlgA